MEKLTSKMITKSMRTNTSWAQQLSEQEYPFIHKMKTPPTTQLHTEVTVRIPTGERTKFGKEKPQRRRFDLVGLVKPFYSAWGNELFTVGFEVKVSKSDLLQDEKYLDYLGYTDFFFFAVPTELVSETEQKISQTPIIQADYIGIYDVNQAAFVRLAERQELSPDNTEKLFRQLLFAHL
ncbi:hypothetical protein [Algivirga pacifica]